MKTITVTDEEECVLLKALSELEAKSWERHAVRKGEGMDARAQACYKLQIKIHETLPS